MQYQSRAFNQEAFESLWEGYSEEEKSEIIRRYVQDEVLYREAKALGLEQNDNVIKRRVIQKMEFILDDQDKANEDVYVDTLREYFYNNQERYRKTTRYTFAHIYFENSTTNDPRERAKLLLSDEVLQGLTSSQSQAHGDRFIYHRNYANRTVDYLESQFGRSFVAALDSLSTDVTKWQGPIASTHGEHLIQFTDKTESGIAQFEDVVDQVKADYLTEIRTQNKDEQIERLIRNYKVKINLN